MAHIEQINISNGGVPKLPVPYGRVTTLGIEGDKHAHPRFHGGPRQALLFITAESIEELIASGWPLFFGALGENITTRGLDRKEMRIGQRYRLGQAVVEFMKVRSPCSTLDVYGAGIQNEIYDKHVKSGDATSSRWGISGFYASVLVTGEIRTGDAIVLLEELA